MTHDEVGYRVGVIQPVECLQEGMELIRGQYWLYVGICAVGMLLAGAVPLGLIMGAMLCGIFLCMLETERGGKVQFELLFKGFDHFAQSLVAVAIQVGAALVLLIPFYILFFMLMMGTVATAEAESDGPPAAFFLGMGLLFLLVFVICTVMYALFAFCFPLIVDRGLSGMDSVKLSLKAGWANLGGLVVLMLLIGVISVVAALFCYLPVFLVLPICMGAIFRAYRRVFPLPPMQEETV